MTKRKTAGIGILAAIVIVALVLNIVLGINMQNIALANGTQGNGITNNTYTSDECYEEGYDVCVNIAGEGAVLLKNKNNKLPLAENEKVSILGAMSFNYVLGGTGSAGGKDDNNTVMMNLAFEEAGMDVNTELWNVLKDACGGARAKNAKYDGITSQNWTGYTTINEFSKNTYDRSEERRVGKECRL